MMLSGGSPKLLALALACGLLGAAAFPPLGAWPLILVSLAGLLAALRQSPPREAVQIGLVYGLAFGGGTMHWFFHIFGPLAVSLVALMGAYFGLFALLTADPRRTCLCRALLVAVFAVGIEWLRGDAWYLRFPWYTPVHALAGQPQLIAGCRWLGVYGLSFAVWLLVAWCVFAAGWRRRAIDAAAGLAALPLLSLGLADFAPPDRQAILIQAEGYDPATQQPVVEAEIRNVAAAQAELVVLPELAWFRPAAEVLRDPRGPGGLAERTGATVVFGAANGDPPVDWENVAAVVAPTGELLGAFTKQHPLPLFNDGRAGTTQPVFPLPRSGEALGVAICYDFDAPVTAAQLTGAGATVLAVPTGDLMSWGRAQHANHELLVRIRAVENDRWILRAVSSGRTEAIDPHGHPSAAGLEIGDRGSLAVSYGHRRTQPLGTRMHHLGPLFAAATLLLGVLFAITRRRASASSEGETHLEG